MKTLFIILFLSSTAFGQENPWENKNKENPWGNQTKEIEKKDTIQISTNQDKKETIIVNTVVFNSNQTSPNEQILVESAQRKVAEDYKIGNDFAVGFTTGLFMNFIGIIPDIPYILTDSKQEKTIQTDINSDSTYATVNDEKLRNKTYNRVKSKKFFATVGGTVTGLLVQIMAFIAIINYAY